MMEDGIRIDRIVSAPFDENAYLLHNAGGSECIVVDPGNEVDRILARIDEQNLTVTAIWNTHGHCDHIAGNEAMKERFPRAPLLIGVTDAPMLTDPMRNLSGLFGEPIVSPPADILVADGQVIECLGREFLVREIPGHSPGHVVFIWQAGRPAVVLGGDVLFAGSVGRTDFPGGNGPQLIAGIRDILYRLPDDALVLPGHGPRTTIGREKATNPFTRSPDA